MRLNANRWFLQVESYGATDAEHFKIGDRHFVVLANEGDIQQRLYQRSVVYELSVVEGDADAAASCQSVPQGGFVIAVCACLCACVCVYACLQ